MPEKKCTKCGEVKPLEMFSKNKNAKDGLCHWCKECSRIHAKEHREKNPDSFKRWYIENREHHLEKHRDWMRKNSSHVAEYTKIYREKNREENLKRSRSWKERNAQRVAEYGAQYRAENAEEMRENAKRWKSENRHRATENQQLRKARKKQSVPAWYQQERHLVDRVYREAASRGWHVDHVVPLRSAKVCGLHCWHNLQVLAPQENSAKGNRHWPDMP